MKLSLGLTNDCQWSGVTCLKIETNANLWVDGSDGVELCVVVERLGEFPDGRLLALPLHPTVEHPLAAALQTGAAVTLDLKRGYSAMRSLL